MQSTMHPSLGTVVVLGIPITGDMKYSDFDTQRNSRIENYRFEGSSEFISAYVSQKISAYSSDNYQKCLMTNAVGISPFVKEYSGDTFVITVVFHTLDEPPAHKRKIVIQSTKNADLAIGKSSTAIASNNITLDYTLQRVAPGAISVNVALLPEDQEVVTESKNVALIAEPPKVSKLVEDSQVFETECKMTVDKKEMWNDEAEINWRKGNGTSDREVCLELPPGATILKADLSYCPGSKGGHGEVFYDKLNIDRTAAKVCGHFWATGDANVNSSGTAHVRAWLRKPSTNFVAVQ